MHRNSIEYKLTGDYALFTDPLTKTGGEKFTYPIPTYQALKGITEAIYWKPTIIWVIDECRVMNRIMTEQKGIRPIKYNGGNDLASYTYLRDVEYRVRAHFEFNTNRSELASDRNENKHHQIALRSLEKGGRRPIFLGTSECPGYVTPCMFEQGIGYYEEIDLSYGIMFHGFTYPDEQKNGDITNRVTRLWNANMQKGVIHYPRPEECSIFKTASTAGYKKFSLLNVRPVEEEELFYELD